jgi:cytochrome c oxidase subunit 2
MKTIRRLALLASLAATLPFSGAHADEPRVIAVTAKRFEFEPKEIHVAKDEPVVLQVKSEDVTHGFFSRPLGFDEDLSPDKAVRIPLKTATPGTYVIICDHFCGSGHGNMKMTIVVQ